MELSVIIPVRNGGADLRACLESLAKSRRVPDECIVVDDGSTDDSAAIAGTFGAQVLSSCGGRGPARARNLGARHASGSILCFFDADVCVHPDALGRIAEAFTADPRLDAIIGAYDDAPLHPGFFSQYKNLQHCFVHHGGRHRTFTFWTGCGAIKRDVFLASGGFDESYTHPCIEDIELGSRLAQAGRSMVLDPRIQVKHRKEWTFSRLVRTDFFDRALPWTELLLRSGTLPNDLNLRVAQRASAVLACLGVAAIGISLLTSGAAALAGWLGLLHAFLARFWIEAVRHRNWSAAAASALWGASAAALTFHASPVAATVFLAAPVAHALFSRLPTALCGAGALMSFAAGCSAAASLLARDSHAVPALLLLAVVAALNLPFYRFLAARRGFAFALACIPVHLLYFVYSVIGIAVGNLRYHLLVRPAAASYRSYERQK